MKRYTVFLSRFSPLHLGHQTIIDKMIADNSIGNSIIMIGSSNVHNDRTPFTLSDREKMIKTIYPKVRIIPIPDINPDKDMFETVTLDTWLKGIKEVETKLNAKFTFYGGSREDINYMEKYFKTVVAGNRKQGIKISATKIRKALVLNNQSVLNKMLDPKIIPMVTQQFKNYILNKVIVWS